VSRLSCHHVMCAKTKIISICPAHFLAERFAKALQVLQVSANLCSNYFSLFYKCGWLHAYNECTTVCRYDPTATVSITKDGQQLCTENGSWHKTMHGQTNAGQVINSKTAGFRQSNQAGARMAALNCPTRDARTAANICCRPCNFLST